MPQGFGTYQLYVAATQRPNHTNPNLKLSFVLVADRRSPMARLPDPRQETSLGYRGFTAECTWGPCDAERESVIAARMFLGQCAAHDSGALQEFVRAPQHIEHVCMKMMQQHVTAWDDQEWVECVLQRLERTTLLQWAVKRPDVTRVAVALAQFTDDVLSGRRRNKLSRYDDGPPVCTCPAVKGA